MRPFLQQVILVFVLFMQIFAYESYKVNVTAQQMVYWRKSLDFIEQFTGKRCTKASPMAEQRFCKKRCELMFYYIPDAPYKNYRFYNKTTKDCESKVICPPIFTVAYNLSTNTCIDRSTGYYVQGVNAKPYTGTNTYEVQFICIHGHVGIYKGRQQCICDFGWKTTYLPGLPSNPKFQKCNKGIFRFNQGILIYEYLPTSIQIYYDPLLSNPYPHPADPEYWPKILINYMKKWRQSLYSTIWPVQVQLTLLVVPTQDFIRTQDKRYLILGGIIFLFIILLSLYEKVKNTRSMPQIIAENAQIQQT